MIKEYSQWLINLSSGTQNGCHKNATVIQLNPQYKTLQLEIKQKKSREKIKVKPTTFHSPKSKCLPAFFLKKSFNYRLGIKWYDGLL